MPSTRTAGPGRRASSSQRGREGSWQVETGKQPNKRPVLHNQRRAQARRIRQESSNNKTEKAPTALTRHHSTPGSACRQVGQTNQMHKPSSTNAFHAYRGAWAECRQIAEPSKCAGRSSARHHDTPDCHMQSCLTCRLSPWLRTWPSVWGQLSHALPVPHRAIYAASVEADRLARAYDPTISDACGRGPSTLV